MGSKLLSRKFLVAIYLVTVTTVALFMRLVNGSEWITFVGCIVGMYGAANLAEAHILARGSKHVQ